MERRFGLPTNVMATKMIPSLAPQTVNPALNVDQFTNLMEVYFQRLLFELYSRLVGNKIELTMCLLRRAVQILYDMLENIDRQQRYKLKVDNLALPSPERRKLRHQMSTDNMNAPPFNIPNLRVDQRKTSSAEDMARKNSMSGPPPTAVPSTSGSVGGFKSKHTFTKCSVKSPTRSRIIRKFSVGTGIGQWFFGSSNSTNNDNNFLRVSSAFPNRRLSDNTLMTPKIRIAPSCASSPGGTPGSTSGLPTRRHSSIGPQERRGSAVNLSPPTVSYIRTTLYACTLVLTLIILIVCNYIPLIINNLNLEAWNRAARSKNDDGEESGCEVNPVVKVVILTGPPVQGKGWRLRLEPVRAGYVTMRRK